MPLLFSLFRYHASPAASHASCTIALYPQSSSPFSPEPSQLQDHHLEPLPHAPLLQNPPAPLTPLVHPPSCLPKHKHPLTAPPVELSQIA
ncbi:hypothetical protein AZE42_13043 [Rhizopogon vesiculosus]|uniref:Uncharacterized protein n=1 Tax=Rhizopogon vesiculosus TaxID=180088 RepID=A0A1J8PG55_9AGAM|nr:hypothetical protein AZE42_13043 [Rhizopogon vesiculosus]